MEKIISMQWFLQSADSKKIKKIRWRNDYISPSKNNIITNLHMAKARGNNNISIIAY